MPGAAAAGWGFISPGKHISEFEPPQHSSTLSPSSLIGDVVGDAAAAEVSAKEFAATDGDAGEVRLSAPATSIAQPESSPVPEAELLSRAQTGDHLAFAQIYNLYKKRIYSLCLRMVGNAAEAEDLTQEAFLQLHRKIATFRGDSAFFTWLHRLTINVVLMQLRKKGLPILSMNEAMDSDSDGAPAQDFGAPDPALTSSIDRMALQRAVDELPAGYRLVFVLHDIEGYEHHEIAALLDCSIGNSKSQLHKARLKLRNALRSDPKQEARP